MTSPDGTTDSRPHFGPRLAARVSCRARAGRQITQHPTIGVVARSSVGFGLAIGMSQGSRPLVTPDTSTSTRLRPPVPIWRRRSDDSPAPTPTPSWAEQITRKASPGRTSARPSDRRQSPTGKAPSQAEFVSSGDRKLDALRRLLQSGPAVDSNDAAPPSPTTSRRASADSDSVRRVPAAEVPTPTTRPIGRRGDTWSGPRTAPGEAGRSFQPEIAQINETNAVLPEATAGPGNRKPTGGAPRSSDRSTDAFQRMLQSRGLISSSPADAPNRPSAARSDGPVRRSPDRRTAAPATQAPRPARPAVSPQSPRDSNDSPTGNASSETSPGSKPIRRHSAVEGSTVTDGVDAVTAGTTRPAADGQLLTADRTFRHDPTRSPTALIRRSNLAAAARAVGTAGPIEHGNPTGTEFDTSVTSLAADAPVAPPPSADVSVLRSAAVAPAERPIATTRTSRLAAKPGHALDQLAQRNGLQHTQSDLRRPATSLVRALATFQSAPAEQGMIHRSPDPIRTATFGPADAPIGRTQPTLGTAGQPVSTASTYVTDPTPLDTGAVVRPPAARQSPSVDHAESAPRPGLDPSASTVQSTTARAEAVQRSPRQPPVASRHDAGRRPSISNLPTSGRTSDRSDAAPTVPQPGPQRSPQGSSDPVAARTPARRSYDPRRPDTPDALGATLPNSLTGDRQSPEPRADLIDGVLVSAPGTVAAGAILRSLDPAANPGARSPLDDAPDSTGQRRSDPPTQLQRPGRLGRLGHFGADQPAATGLRRHSVVRPGPGALQRALDTAGDRPIAVARAEAPNRPPAPAGRAPLRPAANIAAPATDTAQRSSIRNPSSTASDRPNTLDGSPVTSTNSGPAIRRTPVADLVDTVAPPAVSLGDRFMHELSRQPATRPKPLPEQYRPIAQAITGHHRVMLSADHASRRALRSIGKVAATTDNVIHLDRPLAPGPRGAEVLAHELTHVAHPSSAPRFFDDDVRSPEERQAEQVAKVMARAPLAPSGAVSRSRNQRSESATRVIRRSPSADSGSPGTLTAAALATQFTSRSPDATIRRSPVDSSPPAVQRMPDTDTGNALDSSFTSDPGPAPYSDPQHSERAAETFRQQLDEHFDYLLRHLERRMIIELERRGGRFWRGV